MSLTRQLKLCISLIIVMSSAIVAAQQTPFKLQPGDLLFQDLNCGELCDGINKVTYGYNHSYVSHVALYIGSESRPAVIEAISAGVVITPLANFLGRSLDQNKQPRVMVGRLKANYQNLIPAAIKLAKAQLAKPYNSAYTAANGQAFYCSELILYAFSPANQQQRLFKQQPMTFKRANSQQIAPEWQKYYAKLNLAVPEGMPGSNPGAISRESSLSIVYYYGQLRHN